MNTQAAQMASRLAQIDHDERLRRASTQRRSPRTSNTRRWRTPAVIATIVGGLVALAGVTTAEATADGSPMNRWHDAITVDHPDTCSMTPSTELSVGRFLWAV